MNDKDYQSLVQRALHNWQATIKEGIEMEARRHIMGREKLIDDWNGDIEFIVLPHSEQRYDTAGDWNFTTYFPHDPTLGSTLCISISDTGDKHMNLCLFIHELNEALLYMGKHGFTQESVSTIDAWDKSCLEEGFDGEPGGLPDCPCFTEHMVANCAENMALAHFGVDTNEYTEIIANFDYTSKSDES